MIPNPYALAIKDLLLNLNSDLDYGLSKQEASKRITTFNKNEIPQKGPKKKWKILTNQFTDPIIYILVFATLIAFFFNDIPEGVAILIVILITIGIGYFMELQAVRSLESLRKLGQTATLVLRSGKISKIKASLLVPGDIILLNVGDIVPADARLIRHDNLMVRESSLTGESISIEKNTAILPDKTPLTEQYNMVFKGTLVDGGSGKAIITATGVHTQLGKIQQMGMGVKEEKTPLEKKLSHLSKWLIKLTLIFTVLIIIVGILKGKDWFLMLETGVALAVATIPEGLPIVATIALARGMLRLSKKNVIIKNLEAVETLGATNIICTDKTGTLTEDSLKVHTLLFETNSVTNVYNKKNSVFEKLKEEKAFQKMMMVCILCNDAQFLGKTLYGDPLDISLKDFAKYVGYNATTIRNHYPEINQLPFDNKHKLMATVNKSDKGFHIYVKGAFESVVAHCDTILKGNKPILFNDKKKWSLLVDELALKGLRTLAFAYKTTLKEPETKLLLQQLTFIGVIGFLDPAREDVKATIDIYKKAGIRVVMMTGDHLGTAKKIAEEVGLLPLNAPIEKVQHGKNLENLNNIDDEKVKQILNVSVFARVIPEQKLNLVGFYQKNKNIVGMIGDGINDIPALIKADIGITMGIRGTEAAREAADMILSNDKFTAIELAIRQGRVIYQNIRQFVVYLLSSNLAEIISVGLAALLNLPSPLLPLQILFLNLITDIFPALALGLGKGEENIMQLPPRKFNEPIMTTKLWKATLLYGLSISTAVLGITIYSHSILALPPVTINNMAFFTLILAQLLNVFNIPSEKISFLKNEVTTNFWVWMALILCVVLTIAAISIPPVAKALSIVPISNEQLVLVILFAFGSLILAQFIKRFVSIFLK
ncbi:Ca2+-transporting ATPase [Saonia flava]|uniref:Ca2+-transporting ATPase n=1 Tax=Saonia flava TaxID=523696 RepID=A0A846R0I1_9FLAO|nr:cation-transporting P-type ATPase [Saonia flava]NJB70379.1 Ca2+-transporting ATPase [Saonia flava]